ncbi:MAG: hypothetical protein GY894_11575 [Planctomycetes bacterium]|nr:hypothetical protein [Planctomycetota bacterium]MCP4839977.1 hypothetical protein [Planctomycetota bacterium]
MNHERHAGTPRRVITAFAMTGCAAAATAAPNLGDIESMLDLRWVDVQQIDVLHSSSDELQFHVILDGIEMTVELERWSVRSSDYKVLVADGRGTLVQHPSGQVNTWRGSVVNEPQSRAIGSMLDGGLRVGLQLDSDTRWWIEDISGRVAGAAPGDYAVYPQEAIISPEGWCGTDSAAHSIGQVGGAKSRNDWGGQRGTTICTTELACDADYEFYQDYGSVSAVEDRINAVVATVNLQYEAEVDISHAIGTIIVRSSSSDPYSGNSMENRLYQLQDEWEWNQGSIQRDMVQLFTGASDSGSTIGIAWMSAVCTSYAYSVVESDCCGSFGCATDLSAHEMGHNWGADHCNCTSNTMNPYITCSNDFSNNSINDIASYRNSILGCLDCGPPDPTGGCCVGSSCSVGTQMDCQIAGGTWLGDGSDCSGSPCDPTGGCCTGTSCSIETQGDCEGGGGTWLGSGTTCSGDPCAVAAEGACCNVGVCSVKTEADCGGTWLGEGTDCGDNPCSNSGFSGIEYAIVGENLVDDIGENWTVDVYAVLGPGERLDAVAGNSVQQKTITSSEGFWQSAVGGPTSQDVNPAFYDFEPSLEWDSRVTIGSLDSTGAPFDQNNLGDIGIDWSNFESGGAVSAGNGTWYVLPIHEQGEAQPFLTQDCETTYGVRIARLTVLGMSSEVMVEALFQGRDTSDQTWQDTASRTFAWSSTLDCNGNGVADHCDIAAGTSSDDDGDGIPDECASSCLWDLDGDGDTDIDDALQLLGGFGNPYVIDDLLGMLAEFGCGTG